MYSRYDLKIIRCQRKRTSMKPLSPENIESELSYAYLHAVASHAGVGCRAATRHEDNTGVDAQLVGWGPFPGGGFRTEIDLKVQLKATVAEPVERNGLLSYSLRGINQYNDLRSEAVSTPRILVVLFLPRNSDEWLAHTEDALLLRKCAYWVSLRGASPSANDSGQTVYLPRAQRFDSAGITSLMSSLSRGEIPQYERRAV